MLYTAAAPEYQQEGWRVFPLPPRQKMPPKRGVTGYNGKDPSREDVVQWFQADMLWRGQEGFNLGVVLPDDIIALDIDAPDGHSVKADGLETLKKLEAELGPLPPTVTSGHGSPSNPYRHRLYHVPSGLHFDAVGAGIDTIQRTHRYLCAWPSIHPSGERYEWYAPDGSRLGHVPTRQEIAPLPSALVERMKTSPLRPRETPAGPMPTNTRGLDVSGHCKAVQTVLDTYTSDPTYGKSSRHDGWCKLCTVLASMEAAGHAGAWQTLQELAPEFVSMIAPERKSETVAQHEAASAMRSAWEKFGGISATEDPCETFRREREAGRVHRFRAKHVGTF